MADEESSEKTSRRERWKDALHKTKSKLSRKNEQEKDEDFKLSDDVNDFLQAGRPSTSDSGAGRPEPSHDKLLYPLSDDDRFEQASFTNLPPRDARCVTPPRTFQPAQKSPRGVPVPKIDVSRSQRWPRQQNVQDAQAREIEDFLRPAQRRDQRSQSQGSVSGRRKGNRPRNLSVAFLEAPPIIIGEGGDEAEAPPTEIGRAKARARSVSPLPGRGLEGHLQHSGRNQISPGPNPARSEFNSQTHFEPRRPGRVQTGLQGGVGFPTSAVGKSAEMSEFEMSLQTPTPTTEQRWPSPSRGPNRYLPPAQPDRVHGPVPVHALQEVEADQSVPTQSGEHHLRPAIANQDLRMQYEEGEALRHSHYRGLSNSSIIDDAEVSPVSPDVKQLSLDDGEHQQGIVPPRRVSDVSPMSPEVQPGGWI